MMGHKSTVWTSVALTLSAAWKGLQREGSPASPFHISTAREVCQDSLYRFQASQLAAFFSKRGKLGPWRILTWESPPHLRSGPHFLLSYPPSLGCAMRIYTSSSTQLRHPPASTLPLCSLVPAQIPEGDVYTACSHVLTYLTLSTQLHPPPAALTRVSGDLAIAKFCGHSVALNHSYGI